MGDKDGKEGHLKIILIAYMRQDLGKVKGLVVLELIFGSIGLSLKDGLRKNFIKKPAGKGKKASRSG